MPLLEDIFDYVKSLKVYLLGRGLLSLAVFVAAGVGAATGIGVMLPAVVVGLGGALVTAVSRFSQQANYEQKMVDLYRDDIADQLHIAPEEVTRATLKEAAKDNPVIEQALTRQHHKTMLVIGTAILSGLVSCALIGGFHMGEALHNMAEMSFSQALKPIAQLIGMGTVASITSLVLHQGLDAAIGHSTGLNLAVAHDQILGLEYQINHGLPVSREQVYGVLVAGDPALQHTITQRFHKPYARMSHAEQGHLLHEIGVAQEMDFLARDISLGEVKPGHLAFMIGDAQVMTPRTTAAQIVQAEEPVRSDFVERLGLAPRTAVVSHAERLDAQRAALGPRAV